MEVKIEATNQAETLEQASLLFKQGIHGLETCGFSIFNLKLDGRWITRNDVFKPITMGNLMTITPHSLPTIADLDKGIKSMGSHMNNSINMMNNNIKTITTRLSAIEGQAREDKEFLLDIIGSLTNRIQKLEEKPTPKPKPKKGEKLK